jgi:hypothetical protein
MENSEETKVRLMVVTLAIATMVPLLGATIIIAPQQADALSKYDTGANDPNPALDDTKGNTGQPLQQDNPGNTANPVPTTPTLPSDSTVGCAMDTIETLQSFLSCLGAK